MSSIKVTNLQAPSAASPAIVLASDGSATAQLSSVNGGALSGARNRIINGDMRIDQRNTGASVTAAAANYSMDRWQILSSVVSKFTVQQNAGSVSPPAGFTNYLGVTSSAATSLAGTDYYLIAQKIEGFNTADLAWGTANAKAVTVSFWVRSSLTGTFGFALRNNAGNRVYPASYTISAANTWEYKTVSIAGDTTGTWVSDNSIGIEIDFGLGVGSTYSNASGTWTTGGLGVTGATSVVGTNGATWYITGVQLEAGSVATPFERRSYQAELALAQRYYEKGTVPINSWSAQYSPNGGPGSTAGFACAFIPFTVLKRATPSVPSVSQTASWVIAGNTAVSATASHTFVGIDQTTSGLRYIATRVAGGTAPVIASMYMWEENFTWTASAEL